MPLLSRKEVLNLKLSSIPLPLLRELSSKIRIFDNGSATELIKRIVESHPDQEIIDEFIKQNRE